MDITSSAHIKDDLLFPIAPPEISNRQGTIVYKSFGYYLTEIISWCERGIGELFLDHLNQFGLLAVTAKQAQLVSQSKECLSRSTAMPEWVKQKALECLEGIDHVEIQKCTIKGLIDVLNQDSMSLLSNYEADR